MRSVIYLIYLLHGVGWTLSYEVRRTFNQSHIETIERPCPFYSVICIRSYFQLKLGCGALGETSSEPYYLAKISADIPHSNASVKFEGIRLEGLNAGRIVEFYINRDTDTLVLEVEIDKLIMDTEKAKVIYHRKGKEPLEVTDTSTAHIKGLSLTLTIRDIHGSSSRDWHVYAYFMKPKINIKIGAAFVDTTGKDGDWVNLKWFEDMKQTLAETFVKLGPAYLTAFFQTKICDMTIIN